MENSVGTSKLKYSDVESDLETKFEALLKKMVMNTFMLMIMLLM